MKLLSILENYSQPSDFSILEIKYTSQKIKKNTKKNLKSNLVEESYYVKSNKSEINKYYNSKFK